MGIYKALLLAGCAGTVALASPAVAQTVDCNVTPDDASCAGEEEGRIVVTGSRIQRQDFNSTTPMVTADEALLEQSSTAALESNLNKLPQFVPAQTPTAGGDIQPTATNTPGAAQAGLSGSVSQLAAGAFCAMAGAAIAKVPAQPASNRAL